MQIAIYQVDAFTNKVFGGNPAAVCPLNKWLNDTVMQKIAMENSVAETAFYIPKNDGYEIRWFTPEIEMDLCGHATLATAHVIVRHITKELSPIKFYSNSGTLNVEVDEELLTLDFPARMPIQSEAPQVVLDAFEIKPIEVLKSRDYILVYESERDILKIKPNEKILNQINLDPGGVVVTAKGNEVDFVSRFFTPQASIFEDPVTGSAHCSLIPYWSQKLNKKSMSALQLSSRVGVLQCVNNQDRVLISGNAVTYSEGLITI